MALVCLTARERAGTVYRWVLGGGRGLGIMGKEQHMVGLGGGCGFFFFQCYCWVFGVVDALCWCCVSLGWNQEAV